MPWIQRLRSLVTSQETSDEGAELDYETDYESVSSGASYTDCVDNGDEFHFDNVSTDNLYEDCPEEIQQESSPRNVEDEGKINLPEKNSIYPPLSSIASNFEGFDFITVDDDDKECGTIVESPRRGEECCIVGFLNSLTPEDGLEAFRTSSESLEVGYSDSSAPGTDPLHPLRRLDFSKPAETTSASVSFRAGAELQSTPEPPLYPPLASLPDGGGGRPPAHRAPSGGWQAGLPLPTRPPPSVSPFGRQSAPPPTFSSQSQVFSEAPAPPNPPHGVTQSAAPCTTSIPPASQSAAFSNPFLCPADPAQGAVLSTPSLPHSGSFPSAVTTNPFLSPDRDAIEGTALPTPSRPLASAHHGTPISTASHPSVGAGQDATFSATRPPNAMQGSAVSSGSFAHSGESRAPLPLPPTQNRLLDGESEKKPSYDDPMSFGDMLNMEQIHNDPLIGSSKDVLVMSKEVERWDSSAKWNASTEWYASIKWNASTRRNPSTGCQSSEHERASPVEQPMGRISRGENRIEWPEFSDQLFAMTYLDFSTQAFPLLTTLDGKSLESCYNVVDIENLVNVQANDVGQFLKTRSETATHFLPMGPNDPSIHYDCYIDCEGRQTFKINKNKQGTTILHRVLGFDKVLRVFFQCGPKQRSPTFDDNIYRRIAKTGIFVGFRFYEYFVHKPLDRDYNDIERRDLEGRVKCYFVCMESQGLADLTDRSFRSFKSIPDVRHIFMHVDQCPTVWKYIARLQLCLSTTVTIDLPWENVKIRNMEDLPAKDPRLNNVLFTDGVGYMSFDVAELMPINVFKGIEKEDVQIEDIGQVHEDHQAQNSQNYPSLIQTRIFENGSVYKGTLQMLDSLPTNTLLLYNSMRKIKKSNNFAGQSIISFELVSASRDLQRTGKLSQDLILLLSLGGVSEKVFIDAVRETVRKVEMVFSDREKALHAIGDWDESRLGRETLHMLAAGISLDEPGLLKNLLDLTRNNLELVSKGKVLLNDTFYVMGTADPTGTLQANEVAIFRGKTSVCGTVLVYRAPGKHPGDIHKVEAVYSFPLMKVAGQSNQAIFFPTQGARPLPHQIGKGDLDGDLYWVCTNTEVVNSFREWNSRWYPGKVNSKPRTALKALFELSADELEDAMFDDYLNKQLHRDNTVGIASTRWLTHADTYVHPNATEAQKKLHMQELLKYPDYIYEAVDNKSGFQEAPQKSHQDSI